MFPQINKKSSIDKVELFNSSFPDDKLQAQNGSAAIDCYQSPGNSNSLTAELNRAGRIIPSSCYQNRFSYVASGRPVIRKLSLAVENP